MDIKLPKMLTHSFDLLSDPICIVNKESRILHANLPLAKLCGFKTPDGLIGKFYEEVQSTLFEEEEVINAWKEQDKQVIESPFKELKMLEIHPDAVNAPYIVTKVPFYNEDRMCVGAMHHARYIEMFRPNDFIKGKFPGSLLLNKPDDFFTEKECEVIFLKLQSMTSKEIGDALCRSHRTIENKIRSLYVKSGANNLDEFTEFCENRNYHRYIPQSFLQSKRQSFDNFCETV